MWSIAGRRIPKRNLVVLKDLDGALAGLISLRDELLAQADSISKTEQASSKRFGGMDDERREDIERKLRLEDLVARVIDRAAHEGIEGRIALQKELDASAEKHTYELDKEDILREAIDQGQYGIGLHPGLVFVMREITFGNDGLPLDGLIDAIEQAGRKRMLEMEKCRAEQMSHEDFSNAYLFVGELVAVLREQSTWMGERAHIRGGTIYDTVTDVAWTLNAIGGNVESDVFGRRFDEVMLDFMRHRSHLASESMVGENAHDIETAGMLVGMQQALMDMKRENEKGLAPYR